MQDHDETLDHDWAPTDEVAQEALGVLGDASAEEAARARAAIRLGPFMELADFEEFDEAYSEAMAERIEEALWAGYRDAGAPALVRRRCLESLVRKPAEALKAPVREALDGEGRWRLTGIFAAGYLAGFEEDIRAAVASPLAEERAEGWGAVGTRPLPDLAGAAVSVAQDSTEPLEVRFAAIEALETLESDAVDITEALAELAEADLDEQIRELAEAVLDDRLAWEGLDGVGEE